MRIDTHAEAIKFMRDNQLSVHVFPLAVIEKAIERGASIMTTKFNTKVNIAADELQRRRLRNLRG